MHETPHAELSRKLQNIGASPAVASREVAHAMAMSPTSGAEHLKRLGLDYLECFKLLSVATAEGIQNERNRSGGVFKSPAFLMVAGGVMILIGAFGVMRGLSAHSNAVIIDHGITLCFGIFCCVWTVVKGSRK